MKRIKRALKPARKFFHRYINGTKGMISIFLALIMSPLLSISLLLVESARYQSAIQMIEEVMDCAGFSTLAEYDTFLDERFGLMSVSQDLDINSTFSDYMSKSITSTGKSVTLTPASAIGVYPLSDTEIFKQQLQEQSEVSVPTKLMLDAFNVRDMIKEVETYFTDKVPELSQTVSDVKSGADAASYLKKAVEAIENTAQKAKDVSDKYNEYKSAYDDFKEKVCQTVDKAHDLEGVFDHYDPDTNTNYYTDIDQANIYISELVGDDPYVYGGKWGELLSSRDTYVDKAQNLKKSIQALKSSITGEDGCIQKIEDAISKIKKFSSEMDKSGLGDAAVSGFLSKLESTKTQVNIYVTGSVDLSMDTAITSLDEQITHLGKIEGSAGDPYSGTFNATWYTNGATWHSDVITKLEANSYGYINVGAEIVSMEAALTAIVADLNSVANDSGSEAVINDFLKVFDSLKELNCLYDDTLSNIVSVDSLYKDTSLSPSDITAITALGLLIQGIQDIAALFMEGSIVKLFTGLTEVIAGFITFLAAVVVWAGNVLYNIGRIAAGLISNVGSDESWNDILLYGYATYNFPNRTTYDDVKGQNLPATYTWRKVADLSGASITTPSLTGRIWDLQDLKIGADASGSDNSFVGAEMEYLLVGSKSEIQNQTLTFFNLYMLRLVFDTIAIFNNSETKAYKQIPYVGIVLFVVVILVEPFIDVFLLVNPGKDGKASEIPLYKKDYIYFTATGLPYLLGKLDELSSGIEVKGQIVDGLKAGLKAQMEKGGMSTLPISEATKKDTTGLYQCTYTEHMFLMMILLLDPDTMVTRMQNVVSMEGKAKYGADSFNLENAYTYVYGSVDYTLNPMLKIDSLTKSGLFKGKKTRYAGY